jgi:pyruvate formate lyase activating enzyme
MISNGIMNNKGIIFDIQGFSVHDGPGCRTVIFLKGCPLRCGWCANPEGLLSSPEIMYYKSECERDYFCIDSCSHHAISFKNKGDFISINRTICKDCTDVKCAPACHQNALRVAGYHITAAELLKKIQRDRQYWGSGGGITLSGGEPLFQPEFAIEILKQCYDSYIHTALETCGYIPYKFFKDALNYVDWLFFDIKNINSEIHQQGTGVPNKLILENATRLASHGNYRMIIRMTIIPGYNDSSEKITATAKFIKKIGLEEVNILPLHHLGSSKYELLGKEYSYHDIIVPNLEKMEEIKRIFTAYSIKCYIGSLTPF